jgi:hypothetical protein
MDEFQMLHCRAFILDNYPCTGVSDRFSEELVFLSDTYAGWFLPFKPL